MMKEILTTRLVLIAIIFGSAGFGLKALFPFVQRNINFGAFGVIVACLFSFLISILITQKSIQQKYFKLALVFLLIISLTSMLILMKRYNQVTFKYYTMDVSSDTTSMAIPDTIHYLHGDFKDLIPDIKAAITGNNDTDTDPRHIVSDYGGFPAYAIDRIWTKEALDNIELTLFIYYLIFLISLIGATFSFLEVLKYQRYSDEIPKSEGLKSEGAS